MEAIIAVVIVATLILLVIILPKNKHNPGTRHYYETIMKTKSNGKEIIHDELDDDYNWNNKKSP